jgi:O-antigen biosynthesis protein
MTQLTTTEHRQPSEPAAVATKCMCILGMHRSGTSALARVANLLGVDLGSSFIPEGPDNPKGFWEHRGIWDIHERILKVLGSWYDDITLLPPQWWKRPEIVPYRDELIRMMEAHFGSSRLWGFKDPRTCRLLPLWHEVLESIGHDPLFVLVTRNPYEIARSLATRNAFSLNKSLLLTLLHCLEAEQYTRGRARVFVTYDELLENWQATMGQVAERLEITWPRPPHEVAEQVGEFLDAGMRHHVSRGIRSEQPPGDDRLARWTMDVYELLTEAARDPAALDEARIDTIHRDLKAEMPHYGWWRGENSLARRIQHLEVWNEDLLQSRQWLEQENERMRRELEQRPNRRELDGESAVRPTEPAGDAGADPDVETPASDNGLSAAAQLEAWNRELEQGIRRFTSVHGLLRKELEQRDRVLQWLDSSSRELQGVLNRLVEQNELLRAHQEQQGMFAVAHEQQLQPAPAPASTPAGGPVQQPLRVWFDTPSIWQQAPGVLRVSGWCCHPTMAIREMKLSYRGTTVRCVYELVREDVAAALPDWPGSRNSGFSAQIPIAAGRGPLRIEATLEDGTLVHYATQRQLLVNRPPLGRVLLNSARQALRGALFLKSAAVDQIRRSGVRATIGDGRRLARLALHHLRSMQPAMSLPLQTHLPHAIDRYEAWQRVNCWSARDEQDLRDRLATCAGALPKISVLMPVYNPPIEFLELAIQSVINQVHGNWELCIADDCSSEPAVRRTLQKWAEADDRIKVAWRSENGNISRATNSAAELATGEFLLFLDNDDELTPDCLGEVALHLAADPEADFLYSDDDKIDVSGRRFAPQFKPAWSPELLLSYMYLTHVCAVRRSLFHEVGGLRVGYEGSQDYDFALRATERARRVAHLPLVLYHWRALPGSTAACGAAKPAAFEAGRRAVQEALDRRGIDALAHQPEWAQKDRLGLFGHEFPDEGPKVAILIPTRNRASTLRTCIESLNKTTYRNYQIVILDNESDEAEAIRYLSALPHRVQKVANANGSFSFAAINNRAAREVDADYLLFLNNDTEVTEPKWLSRMVGYAQMQGVGAVGARLMLPDGRVQHAGIIHGLHHGLAGHAFKLLPWWDSGYLSYAKVARNYSAVTAACMLTPRKLFLEMGGFDEEHFAVAYNDVDYCYRLVDAGYRCVYCPGAELKHHEGYSRGMVDRQQEVADFRRKYADRTDAYYSGHLSLDNERFEVQPRRPLRRPAPKLRMLAVTNMLNFTGGPLIQFELVAAMKQQGTMEPVVYCTADGPLREQYERFGIEVVVEEHPLGPVLGLPENYDAALDAFAERLQRLNVGTVYGNTLEAFYSIDAARRMGVGSIWNIHESEGCDFYFGRFGSQIAARAVQCFQYPYRVIFGSDATRQVYESLNTHHNFTAVHNVPMPEKLGGPTDTATRRRIRQSLGVGEQEKVILIVGTVCERKGQIDLPRALAKLPPQLWPQLRCFIVGDRPGSYSAQLTAEVQRLPKVLRERVQLVAETPDPTPYYQASDIFVCSSLIECFPRVLLEAMSYGLPIVTTPVYGIREQVQNGVNGLFYDPGRSEQLADALQMMLGNPDMCRNMSQNARQMLRRLDTFDEVVGKYTLMLQEAWAAGAPCA